MARNKYNVATESSSDLRIQMPTYRTTFLVALATALGLACPATAQETAPPTRVRLELAAPDPLWVGQRATLYLDLMATGVFSGTPIFDLPELRGVVVMEIEERLDRLERGR